MSGAGFPFLTTLVLLPAGAAVVVGLLPSAQRRAVQVVGAIASLAVLGIAAGATAEFTRRRRRLPVHIQPPVDPGIRHLLEPRRSTASRCSSC